MNVSLFKRLCEAHPEAVVSLSYQYRMNADILQLSNTLFYNNRLKCGTQEVADAALGVPQITQMLQQIHNTPPTQIGKIRCPKASCWIETVVHPRYGHVVIDDFIWLMD